jgi:hypothetical protein
MKIFYFPSSLHKVTVRKQQTTSGKRQDVSPYFIVLYSLYSSPEKIERKDIENFQRLTFDFLWQEKMSSETLLGKTNKIARKETTKGIFI